MGVWDVVGMSIYLISLILGKVWNVKGSYLMENSSVFSFEK